MELMSRAQAKTKYEADAIAINTMNAQSALSQGKDLDRVRFSSRGSVHCKLTLSRAAERQDGQD